MLQKALPVLVLLAISATTSKGPCQGLTWKKAVPASSPLARLGHAMAYDAAHKQVVLFGGWVSSSGTGETWIWDGSTWTQRKPKTSPSGRYRHVMAYDAARKQIVLFGGRMGSRVYSAETWTWDGSNWTQRKPTTSPPGREYAGMAYDAARQEVVLFGGKNQTVLGDTWTWDGKTWILQKPPKSPPARIAFGFAYDAARKQSVLFGGVATSSKMGDTWLGETRGLRGSFTSYGSGCGRSPAVSLSASTNSLPTVGKSFPTDTKNLPKSSTVSVQTLGASRTLFGPFQLPLSLASLGMPGCHLYTSYDLQWAFAVKNGSGTFSLFIPNSTGLIRSKVYMQSIGIAPGSNAAGILTSNGGEVLIGNLP